MTVNHTSSSGVGKLWERFFWPFSSGTLDVVDVSSLESMFKQALSIATTVGLSLLTRWTVRGVPGVFRCPLNSLIIFAMTSEQSWRGKLKMPELTARIPTEWNLWSSTTLKMLRSARLSFFTAAETCWCRFWRKTRAHCTYYFFLHGRLPALVTIASPVFKWPNFAMCLFDSFLTSGPPALLGASATPPKCVVHWHRWQ